jgi:hypothetical protein
MSAKNNAFDHFSPRSAMIGRASGGVGRKFRRFVRQNPATPVARVSGYSGYFC